MRPFTIVLWAFCAALASGRGGLATAELAKFAHGEQDATTALQEAFDRGGTIHIPRGVFRFSKTLHVTQSDTAVIGEPGSVLLLAPGDVNDGLRIGPPPDKRDAIGSVRNIRLANLTLRNAPENYDWSRNSGTGIGLWGVYGAYVENCRVENFVHDEIAIRVCRDVAVSACSTRGGRHGISLWGHYEGGKWGNRDIRVTACHIDKPWDTGIAVGFFTSNAAITGCTIREARCHGIDIFNVSNIAVSGNVLTNWLSDAFPEDKAPPIQAVGIFVHTDWGVPGAWRIPTENITVSGNTLVHDPFPEGRRPVCIEISGSVSGAVVTGNTVAGGQMALAMNGFALPKDAKPGEAPPALKDIAVANNIFRGQKSLFWIGGKRPEIHGMISGNLFSSKGASGHLAPALKGLTIAGNLFQGAQFPATVPAGITCRDNEFEPRPQTPAESN